MTLEILSPSPPGDGTSALTLMAPTLPTMTLRALVDGVASAVRIGVPREVWLDAAVVSARRRAGGYSIEFGENNGDSSPSSARLEAYLPDRNLAAIRQKLGLSELDPADLEKASLIVRLVVNFHPRHHLGGIVQDINPAIGASLVAKQLDRIRANLHAEGLLHAQSRLPIPSDVRRLAVIHPNGAAAWADVAGELGRLQSAEVLDVVAIPATFEGPTAVNSLLAALKKIREAQSIDLVLLVRGGGASSGLATLANEQLARAVCSMPIPVLTGIGHASDRGLLDEVAWRAADTPSKALKMVLDLIAKPAACARDNWSRIVSKCQGAVTSHIDNLDGRLKSAAASALARLSETRSQLDLLQAELRIAFATRRTELRHQSVELERLRSELLVAAPQAVELQTALSQQTFADGADAVQMSLSALAATMPPPALIGGAVVALLDKEAGALHALGERLFTQVASGFNAEAAMLTELDKTLRHLSVQDTLARGFVLVTAPNGRATVAKAAEAAKQRTLILHFSDGIVAVRPECSIAPQ